MKTLEEKIAVMQAFADGKKISCNGIYDLAKITCSAPVWDWTHYNYDIIKEPEIIYVVKHSSGRILVSYADWDSAKLWAATYGTNCTITKYQEIVE